MNGETMSEKQFVLYEHKGDYYILQNPRLHLDFIEMLGDALTFEEIVEELNQLNDKVIELTEENEQLRQFINKGRRLSVKELINNADENGLLKRKILEQQSTIEHLKKRLYDFEKRKIIEESEMDEDVIPKVKLLRIELFGEKYE